MMTPASSVMRFPERELTNDRYTSIGTLFGLCGFIHTFPVRRDDTGNLLKIDCLDPICLVVFSKTQERISRLMAIFTAMK
jgi:hypothetical protein